MTQQSSTDIEKLLQDPRTAICANCGEVAKPETMGKAIVQAIGILLVVPVTMFIITLLFGANVIHDNSLMLGIVLLASIYWTVQTVKGAVNRTCPNCGKSPMVPLSTSEGQRLLLARQSKEEAQ